jgi:hypothetical protein
MQLDPENIKQNYDMYNRLQNNHRKNLLIFIYQEPKNYTQLMEFSGLKPGSLYHHLNVLMPLIEKRGHGLYAITDEGKSIVEEMDFVDVVERKPIVKSVDENGETEIISKPIIKKVSTKTKIDVIEASSSPSPDIKQDGKDPLALIWLGFPSFILVGIVLTTVALLSFIGISLAGSAIYSIGNSAFLFDLASFVLGIGALYYIELTIFRNSIYNRLKYSFIIRILSMLPGVVIGIGILLLFISDIMISEAAFPWIFTISIVLGTLFASSGILYLRGTTFARALVIATIPSFIDLLLGIIILFN